MLGVIRRNGAGKSTLLKILTRITEPTSGRAIMRGRWEKAEKSLWSTVCGLRSSPVGYPGNEVGSGQKERRGICLDQPDTAVVLLGTVFGLSYLRSNV